MDPESLDNEFMKIDNEITKGITKKRGKIPKINKQNFKRYQNPLIDRLYDRYAQLAPVLEDEFYPNRMRKARTPYWLEYAAYGVQKIQDNQLLRELGNTWVVQRCKSIIIDEVLSNKYQFVPQKTDDYSNDTSNIIDLCDTFFNNMNRRGEGFKDVMRGFLNDTLDLGLGIGVKGFHKDAYYPINSLNLHPEETEKPNIEDLTYVPNKVGYGMMREFTAYDASSFYAQPDHHGSTIGWWQWLNQGTPIFFGEREVAPMILYPVTYSPYGLSPVEVVKNLVSVLVNSVSNMEQFMEDGAVPPAIGVLSKINKSDYEDFIDRWEADVEGNNTEIPIISVGEDGEFKFQPLTLNSADIKQLDTLDVYQKIVMSVFHVTPDELGFTDTSNRSVGEAQAKVQQRVSIFPFMDRIETLVNRWILPELDPEKRVKFEFIRPQTEQDKQAEWSLVERKLNAGVMTINEYLNSVGKPTVPWGNIPFNMGLWTALAERFDISLFGFREEVDNQADTKMDFAQRQILMLIEQMQYMLNSDTDITPDAVSVLTKLRMLNEVINPKGSLGKPSGSVIDLERMIDSANRSNAFETTTSVFNRYGQDSLQDVRRNKEELEKDDQYLDEISKSVTKKKIPVSVSLDITNKLDDKFFDVEGDYDSNITFSNLDKQISSFENSIRVLIVKKFREWHKVLKNIFGFIDPNSITLAFIEQTINRVLLEEQLAKEIEEILMKTFSKGFSFNNEFDSFQPVGEIDFTVLNSDISRWIQENSFASAKEISETLKKKLRNSLREGYNNGESISKLRKRIINDIGVSKETLPKTKDYADLVAKTEVSRVINYAKKTQLEMSGDSKWKYVARLDKRNLNERPNRNGYTCRGLHNKVFSINKTDVMPPLHPNCRCVIVAVKGKSYEAETSKSITTAEADALIPTRIATDAEAAKPHPSEKGRKACVQKKIPILKKEHPEWKMDQIVAVAYHMCGEGHKKNYPVTSAIIGNELFDNMILKLNPDSLVAKTYQEMPVEEAMIRAMGNMNQVVNDDDFQKWEIVMNHLEKQLPPRSSRKPSRRATKRPRAKPGPNDAIPGWLDKLPTDYAISEAERYYDRLKGDKAKQKWEGIIRLLMNKRDGQRRRGTTEADRDREQDIRDESRRNREPKVRKKPKKRRRVKPKESKPRVKIPRPEDRDKITKHEKKFKTNQRYSANRMEHRLGLTYDKENDKWKTYSLEDNEEGNQIYLAGEPIYSSRRRLKMFLDQSESYSPKTKAEILERYDESIKSFLITRNKFEKVASVMFAGDSEGANSFMLEYDALAPYYKEGKLSYSKVLWKDVTQWSRKGSKKREQLKTIRKKIANINSKIESNIKNDGPARKTRDLKTAKNVLVKQLFQSLLHPKHKQRYESQSKRTNAYQKRNYILNILTQQMVEKTSGDFRLSNLNEQIERQKIWKDLMIDLYNIDLDERAKERVSYLEKNTNFDKKEIKQYEENVRKYNSVNIISRHMYLAGTPDYQQFLNYQQIMLGEQRKREYYDKVILNTSSGETKKLMKAYHEEFGISKPIKSFKQLVKHNREELVRIKNYLYNVNHIIDNTDKNGKIDADTALKRMDLTISKPFVSGSTIGKDNMHYEKYTKTMDKFESMSYEDLIKFFNKDGFVSKKEDRISDHLMNGNGKDIRRNIAQSLRETKMMLYNFQPGGQEPFFKDGETLGYYNENLAIRKPLYVGKIGKLTLNELKDSYSETFVNNIVKDELEKEKEYLIKKLVLDEKAAKVVKKIKPVIMWQGVPDEKDGKTLAFVTPFTNRLYINANALDLNKLTKALRHEICHEIERVYNRKNIRTGLPKVVRQHAEIKLGEGNISVSAVMLGINTILSSKIGSMLSKRNKQDKFRTDKDLVNRIYGNQTSFRPERRNRLNEDFKKKDLFNVFLDVMGDDHLIHGKAFDDILNAASGNTEDILRAGVNQVQFLPFHKARSNNERFEAFNGMYDPIRMKKDSKVKVEGRRSVKREKFEKQMQEYRKQHEETDAYMAINYNKDNWFMLNQGEEQ